MVGAMGLSQRTHLRLIQVHAALHILVGKQVPATGRSQVHAGLNILGGKQVTATSQASDSH